MGGFFLCVWCGGGLCLCFVVVFGFCVGFGVLWCLVFCFLFGNIYWCMCVDVFCGSGFCCGGCGGRVVYDDVHDEFVCCVCGLVYPDLGVVVEECDGAP